MTQYGGPTSEIDLGMGDMKKIVLAIAAVMMTVSSGAALADDNGFPNWIQRQERRDYHHAHSTHRYLASASGSTRSGYHCGLNHCGRPNH